MFQTSMQTLRKTAIAACAAIGLVTAAGAASAADDKTIKIGWTAWSDAEFVTKMAAKVLEQAGYKPELQMADIGVQYKGVEEGDLDLMLMAWLPATHADYWKDINDDAVNLGILYTGAKLGWAVPDYVDADIKSIADLKGKADMFDGKIQGIDPGAGLMRLSKEAVKEYGLDDYQLVSASGAGMTAALARAVERKEPIVVTAWSPHWMFGKWKLRYLEDPKGVLGKAERVCAISRPGFYQDMPEAAAIISRIQFPLADLEKSMFEAQETSYEEAVDKFLANNKDRVQYWLTGEIK